MDVTNPLGAIAGLGMVLGLGLAAMMLTGAGQTLACDALLLLVPHWLTGTRRILQVPGLMVRIAVIQAVLHAAAARLARHRVQLLMLLAGATTRLPRDVKFKVDIAGQHPDFLGLYGQVVINEVQGTSYPYFYVVLVARDGFGLARALGKRTAPDDLLLESKKQDSVEVLVLRQRTTKTSGYPTTPARAAAILEAGLDLAERVAAGPQAATAG